MRDACEIVVYVRSRHVVTDAHEVRAIRPVAATLSQPAFIPVRRFEVVFGHRLDWTQGVALAEARRLGARTGNPVRVVDLGRMNPVSRAVRRWVLGGRALPIVVLRGSCPWHRLGDHLTSQSGARA